MPASAHPKTRLLWRGMAGGGRPAGLRRAAAGQGRVGRQACSPRQRVGEAGQGRARPACSIVPCLPSLAAKRLAGKFVCRVAAFKAARGNAFSRPVPNCEAGAPRPAGIFPQPCRSAFDISAMRRAFAWQNCAALQSTSSGAGHARRQGGMPGWTETPTQRIMGLEPPACSLSASRTNRGRGCCTSIPFP